MSAVNADGKLVSRILTMVALASSKYTIELVSTEYLRPRNVQADDSCWTAKRLLRYDKVM